MCLFIKPTNHPGRKESVNPGEKDDINVLEMVESILQEKGIGILIEGVHWFPEANSQGAPCFKIERAKLAFGIQRTPKSFGKRRLSDDGYAGISIQFELDHHSGLNTNG
jgi:hypothetical protein